MAYFFGHHTFHPISLTFSFSSPKPKPKPFPHFVTYANAKLPPTDKVINFGKYKGRMLGTLPSTYLKWVSNNLKTRDFEDWAYLADQVLQDPLYNDRLEWEFAERIMNGDVLTLNNRPINSVNELVEISHRFGWDNEDKLGWSKVDFQLLGTSKSGRIPRVNDPNKKSHSKVGSSLEGKNGVSKGGSSSEKRVERRERLKVKRRVGIGNINDKFESNVNENECQNFNKGRMNRENQVKDKFPGREGLLRKVLSRKGFV